MYKKLISIDVSKWTAEQAAEYVRNVAALFYSGSGTTNTWAKKLPISEEDGLRVLLGVPESWLTEERQRVFEAVYAYTFNLEAGVHSNIWGSESTWHFVNPNPKACNVYNETAVLDLKYLESLGLRLAVWEKNIFISPVTTAAAKKGEAHASSNYRALMALFVLGMPKPANCFVIRKHLNTN